MAENTKVVIVGGGHNGLVAAGYLGRAGLDVQVLERRDVVGGAAVTEEWFPGFHISTCSYVCHILQQKVIDELELRNHGFHVYPLDPGRLHPFPDGRAVRLWHDDEKTAEEIRQFSPEDAEAWLDWADFWHRAVRILSDYYLQPPPSLAELTERFKDEEEEELLETLLTVPLRDLIDRTFVSEEMKAMASIGAIDMGEPQRARQRLHHGALPVQRVPQGHGELRDRSRRHGVDHAVNGTLGRVGGCIHPDWR